MTDSTIKQQVLARAIKDAAFRQELLGNPRAALAREFKMNLPEAAIIRVLEDTPTTFTLVLPPQEAAVLELSDADLEAVAGAYQSITCWCNSDTCR